MRAGELNQMKRQTKAGLGLLELVARDAAQGAKRARNQLALSDLREEIETVIGLGHGWCAVWRALRNAGKVDLSYGGFLRECRAIGMDSVAEVPLTGGGLQDLVAEEAQGGLYSGKNRAVVTELRDEIERTLAFGYTWRVIWSALSKAGAIEMSYDRFRLQCKKLGLRRPPEGAPGVSGGEAASSPYPSSPSRTRAGRVDFPKPAVPTTHRPPAKRRRFLHPADVPEDDL